MIVKVKEPQAPEVALLEPRHTLFTYLHLAPDPELTRGLVESGATCVAYETVEDARGRLPLLAPMSEVAGKIATQAGAFMLEKPLGGRGILLGGVPGVAAAKVMIIGGGVVGMNAAFIALGMEATVYVYDRNIDRLRELDIAFGGRADTCYASTLDIEQRLPEVDLVIGAVLVHGAKAPYVIRRDQLALMKRQAVLVDVVDRPGRLLRDVAADDPQRPHLRGRRRPALLRGEHAGRGAGHVDARADQRDDALHRARGQRGRRAGRAARTPGWPRASTSSTARSRTRRSRRRPGSRTRSCSTRWRRRRRSCTTRSSSAAATTAWSPRRISRARASSVLVLERRDHVGGAAVSERPWPGVDARLSRYSYLVSLMPRALREELGLRVEMRRRAVSSYSPRPDGSGLFVVRGSPPTRTGRRSTS